MDETMEMFLTWKGVAVLVWLSVFFLGERLAPAAAWPGQQDRSAAPGGWHRVLRNLGLWFANVGLSPLVVLPLSLWAADHHLGWRPDWWSGGLGLAVDLILLDFLIYWWHRANHVVPLLWRFHEVHHLDRFLDTTTALRFHFGEVLLSAGARALVIMLLDIPILSILVFETLVLVCAIFHHSNLRLPAGLEATLSKLVITPSIHWVHHHARRAETDSNYGTIFSFWDPLFASRSDYARHGDMTIGVEAKRERPFAWLLVWPFLSEARQGRD